MELIEYLKYFAFIGGLISLVLIMISIFIENVIVGLLCVGNMALYAMIYLIISDRRNEE